MSSFPGGGENLVFGIRIDRSNIGPDMRAARAEITRELAATKAGVDKIGVTPTFDTRKIKAESAELRAEFAKIGEDLKEKVTAELDRSREAMSRSAESAKNLGKAYAAVDIALAMLVGRTLENVTGAIEENVTAMRRGEASTGDLVDATLKAIPGFSSFYQAALNVREALTGENEEIRKQTVLLGELIAAREAAGNAGGARRAALEQSREGTADMAADRAVVPGSRDELQLKAGRDLREHAKSINKPIDEEIQKQKGIIESAKANYAKGSINRDQYEDFRDNANKTIAGLEKQRGEALGSRGNEVAQKVADEWREKVGGALIDAGGELLKRAAKQFDKEVQEATKDDTKGAAEERKAIRENEKLAESMDRDDARRFKKENQELSDAMDASDRRREQANDLNASAVSTRLRREGRTAEADANDIIAAARKGLGDTDGDKDLQAAIFAAAHEDILGIKGNKKEFAEAVSAASAAQLNLMGGDSKADELTSIQQQALIQLQDIAKKIGPARTGP